MTTTYRGTHRMIVVISKEELAFLNMYPPQIKLGLIGFTAGFKKNNQAFEKFLKPLVRICNAEIKLILQLSAEQLFLWNIN